MLWMDGSEMEIVGASSSMKYLPYIRSRKIGRLGRCFVRDLPSQFADYSAPANQIAYQN